MDPTQNFEEDSNKENFYDNGGETESNSSDETQLILNGENQSQDETQILNNSCNEADNNSSESNSSDEDLDLTKWENISKPKKKRAKVTYDFSSNSEDETKKRKKSEPDEIIMINNQHPQKNQQNQSLEETIIKTHAHQPIDTSNTQKIKNLSIASSQRSLTRSQSANLSKHDGLNKQSSLTLLSRQSSQINQIKQNAGIKESLPKQKSLKASIEPQSNNITQATKLIEIGKQTSLPNYNNTAPIAQKQNLPKTPLQNLQQGNIVKMTNPEYKKFLEKKHPAIFKLNEENVNVENIEKILFESLEGTVTIFNYKKNESLDKADQQMVADILINRADMNAIKHPAKFCSNLADSIIKLFPRENKKIFYIPPHSEMNASKDPKGKLFDKWRNLRFKYCTAVEEPKSSKKLKVLDTNKERETAELTDSIKIHIKWLKHNRAPVNTLITHWTACRDYRLVALKTKPYDEIFKEWPILHSGLAIKLITLDFKHSFPDKYELFDNNFENFFKIIYNSQKKYVHDDKGKMLVRVFEKYKDDDNMSMDFLKLLLIPYLLPLNSTIRMEAGSIKPMIYESSEGFLVWCKRTEDIKEFIAKRLKRYTKWGSTEQPCIVVVAEKIHQPLESYVYFNQHLWKAESPLEALRATFMLLMLLDMQYPVDAAHIWLVIQRKLYGITTKNDKRFTYCSQFLVQVENIIDKNQKE